MSAIKRKRKVVMTLSTSLTCEICGLVFATKGGGAAAKKRLIASVSKRGWVLENVTMCWDCADRALLVEASHLRKAVAK